MRDRWVAVYLVLVLLQLPLYVLYGKAPLSFDFAAKAVENGLRKPFEPGKNEARTVERALRDAQKILDQSGDTTSRKARLDLDRGVLAWKKGHPKDGVAGLEKARKGFVEHHGADSFYAAALDLRVGELLFLQRNYVGAIDRFERSLEPVKEYMGPRDPFTIRMTFRLVSSLVNAGMPEKAGPIATANLGYLKSQIQEFDMQFVYATAGSLDLLARRTLVPAAPPELGTWRAYLQSLQESSNKLRGQASEADT